jgi:hypothetical protein
MYQLVLERKEARGLLESAMWPLQLTTHYAELKITQKPSWVKHPITYTTNSSSLLVTAFEDPDRQLIQNLIDSRHLYMFRTCVTVKPWQQ